MRTTLLPVQLPPALPRRHPCKLENVNVDHCRLPDLVPTLRDGCPRFSSIGLHRAHPGALCLTFLAVQESRELVDVNVEVCGLNGLTAVQLSEDEDARLIGLVACRRGEGFVSVLDERKPVDLLLIMTGTYYP